MAYDKPNYYGGPITNARRLLPELQKRGHEVHAMIFFDDGDAPTARYLESQGVKCHLIPNPHYTQFKITWILQQLQEIEPDIFVPNIFPSGYYAAKWVQKAGIPSIAAHRSNDDFHWQMVREFVIGDPQWSVAGLVCVNHQLKKDVEKLNPQHTQLCVIPSGVLIPQQSSSQTELLKIAYVGRLVQQQKRVRDTLEALIKVTQTLPDVTVTFFGEGNERAYLEQRVREANLPQKIHFAGAVPSEKLHQHLVEHHVLVLLSDYEGTPGAVMDGMACGLVPVCTDISGGVQELVIHSQTGFLVRDRAESFLEAIQTLYENPELRTQLAKNAREHIIKEYSLDIAATRWENFCIELMKSAKPPSKIKIPWFYNLPPAQNCRDFRKPPIWKKTMQRSRQVAGKLKRRILS